MRKLLLFLLLIPCMANATSVRQMTLDELIEKSGMIFVGKVISSDPYQFDSSRN